MGRSALAEREAELTAIEALLDRARAGTGATLLVEGPPGIGKTSLLGAAAEMAGPAGFTVLKARPGPLEHDLAWSVARDLFGRALARLDESERTGLLSGAARFAMGPLGLGPFGEETGAPDVGAPLYGLYWLCSNLAQRAPLLLLVDDAHWADPPSARLLAYLVQRAPDLPAFVVIALRSGEPVDQYLKEAGRVADVLRPAPLSSAASAIVVRQRVGDWADEALCQACQEATGGNPLLLEELADELARLGPSTRPAEVAQLKPATVTRTVLLRLARLPLPARRLALAVTVLGRGETLATAAALLGMTPGETAQAHDLLTEADILAPGPVLDAAHPLVGEIIYAGSAPAARWELHHGAARLHDAAGRPVEDVAAQLVATLPGQDPWVVGRLRSAAEVAMSRAAPGVAVTYLSRALAEQLGPPNVDVLIDLGVAESCLRLPAAVDHLLQAHNCATEPAQRAEVVLLVAPLLVLEGRLAEAAELCTQALGEAGGQDGERKLRLVANIVSAALLREDLHPVAARAMAGMGPELEGTTPGERVVMAMAARAAPGADGVSLQLRDSVSSAETARRALAGGLLLAEVGPGNPVYWYAATALIFPGWYGEAAEAIDAGLSEARRCGSALGFALASCFRSQLHYRQGRLADALADTRQALQPGAADVTPVLRAYATSFLLGGLVDAGAYGEAKTVLDGFCWPPSLPQLFAFALVQVGRAQLALATGNPKEAADLLVELGPAIDAHCTPAVVSWRAPAAIAFSLMGQAQRARQLAADDVAMAEAARSPWAVSVSLRASGLAHKDIDLLGQAVAAATRAGAPLEEARALYDLGAMHRRAGARRAARNFLEAAAQRADDCGASGILAQAEEELVVCGGSRPTRRRLPHGLTPSEQRVADMALTGMTNPEIAQALFVSLRTVETHLTHVYRKLGVDNRHQLSAALGV